VAFQGAASTVALACVGCKATGVTCVGGAAAQLAARSEASTMRPFASSNKKTAAFYGCAGREGHGTDRFLEEIYLREAIWCPDR
jgi:hypothetical protein